MPYKYQHKDIIITQQYNIQYNDKNVRNYLVHVFKNNF